MADEHHWVQQRFPGLALGTLEDASRARSEAHLASCADCRERYAEFGAAASAETGHLSPAMIARWDRARHALGGLEREAVRLHLQHCASCDEELKLVGQTASLSLEVAPRRRPTSWAPWLGGGVVGALATAASLLWFVDPSRTVPPAPLPSETAPSEETPTVDRQPPELVALPWVAPAALRGDAVSLLLPAATHELLLALAVAKVADDSASLLRIYGPNGVVVAATSLDSDAVRAGSALVLLRNADGLQAGSYRVVLRAADSAPAPDSTESYFELELSP